MMYSIAPIYGLDLPIEYERLEYNGIEVLACKTAEGYILERIYATYLAPMVATEYLERG